MKELILKRKSKDEILKINTVNEIPYLTFPLLEKTGMVTHAFSTRMGGVSTGFCSSLNFAAKQGDSETNVRENYRRMADAISVDPHRMVLSRQTHTTNVRVITEKDAGKGYHIERDYDNVDGLVTNIPGITLVTHFADCVPLYFVDPIHRAIGLSHSGWRGTVNQMGKRTLTVMKDEYGTDPSQVVAAIGPSICQSCYEVSEDVAAAFKELISNLQKDSAASIEIPEWPAILQDKGNGKYQLNLWEANRLILLAAGVLASNIQVTDICTCCNSSYLFSHRATGGKRGTLAAFLMLKEQ
ncbi:MAG: peptidoglycan editing factor PgeF [Clostridiales bacterium]|nr:peptidoglycan editing factor PgeF [Clostridiales bacterium]